MDEKNSDILLDNDTRQTEQKLMPNKYANKKGWNVPKQRHKLTNWSEYNAALASLISKKQGEMEGGQSDSVPADQYDSPY